MTSIYSFVATPSQCDWTLKLSPVNVILMCLVSHTSNIISLTTTNYTQQSDWYLFQPKLKISKQDLQIIQNLRRLQLAAELGISLFFPSIKHKQGGKNRIMKHESVGKGITRF